MSTNFREAKLATLYPATPDARGFFESVLGFSEGTAETYIRVSAADQRRYFGRVPFGKCALKVSQQGVIRLIKTKAFGRDFDSIEVFYCHLRKAFASNRDGAVVLNPANI